MRKPFYEDDFNIEEYVNKGLFQVLCKQKKLI